jgi:isopenicillin-N N-acyltransferase-like protein
MDSNTARLSRRSLLAAALPLTLSGCFYQRVDLYNVLLRSDRITSGEEEKAVLSKAWLTTTVDGRVKVLCTRGTPYEQGYQHGVLLREEVRENLTYLYEKSIEKFKFKELFAEAYERQRPFIPQAYIDEMHGLAHGAKLDLEVVHAIHALPEITEWGGKKQLVKVVKKMIAGEDLGTTCSNVAASASSTADGRMYVVRILDWGMHRISKLHEHPLLHVSIPDTGYASLNIGWIGFLGAVSGMNEREITLGEMGAGDDPSETMNGTPMPFLLREILNRADNLADVRNIITSHPGTNKFVYLMSDGKAGRAEMYLRDRNSFRVAQMGEKITVGKHELTPNPGVVYGGHYPERMRPALDSHNGRITPEILMKEMIPSFAMPSNFQNVVYDPRGLKGWVSNAKSKSERAAEQPYTEFDFGRILSEFRARQQG